MSLLRFGALAAAGALTTSAERSENTPLSTLRSSLIAGFVSWLEYVPSRLFNELHGTLAACSGFRVLWGIATTRGMTHSRQQAGTPWIGRCDPTAAAQQQKALESFKSLHTPSPCINVHYEAKTKYHVRTCNRTVHVPSKM
eukprot:3874703-Rhodomonas_salina.3